MKILTPAEAKAAISDPVTEYVASVNASLAEGTRWASVITRYADGIATMARESGWIVNATVDSNGMFTLLEFDAAQVAK